MNKIKVMTVVGTRPEIIKLSEVIKELDNNVNHTIVHTGQNYDYELNELFFEQLDIRKPDIFLDAVKGTPSETVGDIIAKSDKVYREIKPDAVLIYGDTNSCLTVIAAKKRKIPIFHMEAGNRCFDLRVPEEVNRKIVDHLSDINLPISEQARDYLIAEGIRPETIIKIGSCMEEVLDYYRPKIDKSDICKELNLKEGKYFVVSAHREENINHELNFCKLVDVLNTIASKYNLPVIVSTHPRTQKRIDSAGVKFHKNIQLLKPLGFKDYNKLQISSKAVLSDSGTINEESSILNFPALNIREAHERPEGMEEASVMMVGLEIERIQQALTILENQPRGTKRTNPHSIRQVSDYSMPNVSDKVVRIIHSYTDYVKRVVWREY